MRVSSMAWTKDSVRPVHLSIWQSHTDEESGEYLSLSSLEMNLTPAEAESIIFDLQQALAELKVPATK